MPKVSIVLPVYNGEKYLSEAIDSIISQTYKDWELIIINDCSTDNTSSIIQEYIEKDNRIRTYMNKINQKLPRSLNIGFGHAIGEYLSWTSDDNIYLPTAIEEMVRYLEDNPDDVMVVADMCIFDESNKRENILSFDEAEIYIHNCVGACFLYRKTVMDIIGGYDPERFLVEDYDYWLRILFECGSIGHISKCLYRYRYHARSLTSTEKQEIHIRVIELLTDYMDRIIHRLSGNRNLLVCLYYEMLWDGIVAEEMLEKLANCLPEVRKDIIYEDDKPYVIYGAGDYGKKAKECLGENAVAYIDGNPKLLGKEKDGMKIYGIDDISSLYKDYHVMIAADARKIYGMIGKLEENGIHEFCTWIKYSGLL